MEEHRGMQGTKNLLSVWLLAMTLPLGALAALPPAVIHRYPDSPFVIVVTQPPYSARGDGITDDTEAVQRALNDVVGQHKVLFFPVGTYLVSRTLTWPKNWNNHANWGHTLLRGEDRDRTILRLRDGTFTNAAAPKAIMWCGGFGSADWFHNYVENLTFDVGTNNKGATGLQFYSNNSGAVRDCRFIAAPGNGVTGLDLAHRDMNGPLLVRNVEVVGFGQGITTSHAVNSQTFENIHLRDQREFGFDNSGQYIAIRTLISDNAVPAIRSYGTLCLLDSTLTGRAAAAEKPAIINYNGGRILLRDVRSTGYSRTLGDVSTPDWTAALRVRGADRPGSMGPKISEYSSKAGTALFPTSAGSARLPIKETPEATWEDPRAWANVDAYGADPTGAKDSSGAIQKAIDSGASTVFLPGSYNLRSTVLLRGRVNRVVGLGGHINYGHGLKPDFRLQEGDASTIHIEHLANIHGGLMIDTRRTVVMRSVSDCDLTFTPASEGGEIYLEDVVTHGLRLKRQRVWARQLDVENEGTHLTNDGSDLWILGYKTERGGTLLEATGGSRSEILGNFSYTTTAGGLAPMFINRDSSIFAFFGEVCFNGNPFTTLVQETRGTETRTLHRTNGHTIPYLGTR
jgi:hypothetical protein